MLRAATSRAIRQAAPHTRRGAPLAAAPRWQEFHVSVRRDDEAKAADPPAQEKEGWYHPIYGIAAGVCFAVPVLNYEWYLVNEETQLASCFIAFCGIMYKLFGKTIEEGASAEGEDTLVKTNAAEDVMMHRLANTIEDLKSQQGLLADLESMKELKAETYAKLNETGQVKPLHAFKAQMEKMLAVIAAEEKAGEEKAKMALMAEATEAVRADFATSKDLQKKSLANAVALLKGTKTGAADPVKDAYLKFFANKKKQAEKMDEKDEIKAYRSTLLTKMSAVAMTEKFYFEFDSSGQPKMVG